MNFLEKEESSFRLFVLLAALFATVILVVAISMATSAQTETTTELRLVDVLFDRSSNLYPFTVQNVMWLFFFVCAGEIWVRWQRANTESMQMQRGLVTDDPKALYRSKDLSGIYRALEEDKDSAHYFLQRLIRQVILQFQITNNSDQANSVMNTSLELIQHEVELKYNMVRYLVWLIPTLGFIGTVIGIALSLSYAGDMPDISDSAAIKEWVALITIKLGIAFNTTLVALIMSAGLVFFLHIAQGREEKALNYAGQYCLDRLVNRLYAEKS